MLFRSEFISKIHRKTYRGKNLSTSFFAVLYIVFASLALLLSMSSSNANELSLEEYLNKVIENHKEIQSLGASKKASEKRRMAGDIELSPTMTLNSSYLSDEKLPQMSGTKTKTTQYHLGIEKKFSTGTAFEFFGNLDRYQTEGESLFPSDHTNYSTGTFGVTLSQSLWKNSFGRSTKLRREREKFTEKFEQENLNLKEKQILCDAELAYWDYLYLQKKFNEQANSLRRSQQIVKWLKNRATKGIGEPADIMNAEAFSMSQKLELSLAYDELETAEQSIRDYMELNPLEKTPLFSTKLDIKRNIAEFIRENNEEDVIRVESYLTGLEWEEKRVIEQEVEDSQKPDLVLYGAAASNSYSTFSQGESLKHITDGDKPTYQLGMKLIYTFGTQAKNAQISASRMETYATQLRRERKQRESSSEWIELKRKYSELIKQIKMASTLSSLQSRRAEELSRNLSKGRAITTDVINAEQDAASTALSLNRLLIEARKIEAKSKLFIKVER